MTNAFTFCKHWAMEESALMSLPSKLDAAQAINLDSLDRGQVDAKPYEIINGVAVIEVTGPLSKYEDIFMQIFGGTSTQCAKNNFYAALDDPQASAILLYIDSPGGQVAGTGDFANAIANSTKPVVAYISDMGASAAYWIASQADSIYANPTATVGSIGVYCVLQDSSRLYEDAGVKVNLVKAGEFKGVGEDGVEITDQQLADVQREINEIYQVFVGDVAAGRGLSEANAKQLATGQVWIASAAKHLGLIDGVASIESVISQMTNGGKKVANKSNKVADAANEVVAAEVAKAIEAVEAEVKAPVASAPVVEATPATPEAKVEDASAKLAASFDEGFKKGVAEALASEKARMSSLLEMAKGRASFAAEQFIKGNSKEQAAIEYAAVLEIELQEAKSVEGAKPLNLRTAEQRAPKVQFSDLFQVK